MVFAFHVFGANSIISFSANIATNSLQPTHLRNTPFPSKKDSLYSFFGIKAILACSTLYSFGFNFLAISLVPIWWLFESVNSEIGYINEAPVGRWHSNKA
jgi:hypothetical protein